MEIIILVIFANYDVSLEWQILSLFANKKNLVYSLCDTAEL